MKKPKKTIHHPQVISLRPNPAEEQGVLFAIGETEWEFSSFILSGESAQGKRVILTHMVSPDEQADHVWRLWKKDWELNTPASYHPVLYLKDKEVVLNGVILSGMTKTGERVMISYGVEEKERAGHLMTLFVFSARRVEDIFFS